ncbi:MAG: glutamine--fructose-6-phosphate transaminase (isomerizing) [Bdellovibrionaceae bacterium]|nr:glutamine--fructose-6-phosphate transaminase (isomerizing) [Pseudobdellovibrionaceae bacterium]
MCGIVGYYGPKDPKSVILEGLQTLEYRGYDSAGVAILNGSEYKRIRAEGKLAALADKLADETFDGAIGIGHTRWATHGPPSERNAHPHCIEGVNIVHNGIIENYAELREELMSEGATFSSDTDSELVAHLINKSMKSTGNLMEAVMKMMKRLEGAYSILAVSADAPEEMVAFKNGPPLILGVGEKELVVASDIQAIMPHTNKVIFLEDDEVVYIRKDRYELFNRSGGLIKKEVEVIDWSPEQVEKQGFKHYMLKEIFEQPRAVAQAIDPHINLETKSVALTRVGFGGARVEELPKIDVQEDLQLTNETLEGIERIFIVACGTSYYAGQVGEYLIEQIARVPVECDIGSEFRYRYPVIPENSLVITISQSGETADTLAALRLVKQQGAKVLSICNVRRSSIDREADGHLYMNAGAEIGVASTKAFVSTLSLLQIFAIQLAKVKGVLNQDTEKPFVEALVSLPSQMEKVLVHDKFFEEAASSLKTYRGFLYMGRGVSFPIAMEGALKLKELAYMHAEGYAAGEMKHGPLALIDESMAVVMLVANDELYDKTVSNLEEAKARGGQIISIGSGENQKLQNLSLHYLSIPEAHWTVNPVLQVLPLQLLAYHVASSLGHDVDQPRNLAKSVTVE